MSAIKVFKYSMGWTWVCSSCGIGVTSPQWQVWDTQPAALIVALRHCRASGLRRTPNTDFDLYAALRARARRGGPTS